jgi:adenosine kinase
MTALVCGSLAFDTVMVFQGRFREQILADRIHMLNVSFLVPSMRRNFGGCAGNIAYNLRLLGEKGEPMGTVGHDFEPYRRWLKACGVSLDYVRELDDEFTAQAFITTDLDDNQITAFHPGAMTQ